MMLPLAKISNPSRIAGGDQHVEAAHILIHARPSPVGQRTQCEKRVI